MRPVPLRRRSALLLLPGLAGCSLLPDRPFRETPRFALAPEPPVSRPAPPGAPVLLVRSFRAAPGLESRGLRTLAADGQVSVDFYAEWAALPADLAEEAVRRWLAASGRFAATVAPGSRVRAEYILEGQLSRLEIDPAAGVARAELSLVLIADAPENARVLATPVIAGTAPLDPARPVPAAEAAAAMRQALATALAALMPAVEAGLPAGRRR